MLFESKKMKNVSQFEEQQLKKLAVASALEFAETKCEEDLEAFIDFVTAHVITHIKYQLVENNTKHTKPKTEEMPLVGAASAEADWHKWSVEQPLIKKPISNWNKFFKCKESK
jgi:hypothetical protein